MLQDIQGFLLAFPVFGADYDKVASGSSGDPERLVAAEALFYKTFQVLSELVEADCIHLLSAIRCAEMPYDSTKSPGRHKQPV